MPGTGWRTAVGGQVLDVRAGAAARWRDGVYRMGGRRLERVGGTLAPGEVPLTPVQGQLQCFAASARARATRPASVCSTAAA
jgi:hypothetical protein